MERWITRLRFEQLEVWINKLLFSRTTTMLFQKKYSLICTYEYSSACAEGGQTFLGLLNLMGVNPGPTALNYAAALRIDGIKWCAIGDIIFQFLFRRVSGYARMHDPALVIMYVLAAVCNSLTC